MTPQNNALELLERLISEATATLAKVNHTIGIVLAPNRFALDAMQQAWMRTHGSLPDGEHFTVFLVHRAIVVGHDMRPGHPLHGKITIWADVQFQPPCKDDMDKDDLLRQCPALLPVPDSSAMPLERALWDIKMTDWIGHISSTVRSMIDTEPAFAAELDFAPHQ